MLTKSNGHRVWLYTLLLMLLGSVANAQQNGGNDGADNGNGGNTGNAGTSGGGGGAGLGAGFDPGETDMSAFDGIQRGDSISGAETQGFGLTTDGGLGSGRAGGGGFGGGMGGLGGLFGGLGGAFGGQGATTQKPVIRVRLRSAIGIPPRPEATVQQTANRVFDMLPAHSGVDGVNVRMNGRTAILTGSVSSEKERRMSELLMRLEPGVSSVQNEVVVAN
ncbi:BON domain-containing protein [Stieleria tagensis]|uniref:BON domain-containing protein n=1 Tax=Stieleria tagensis TaxID=2956795 RepID=UPI00209AFE1C|nr:BON domain-containing protein [Stieleria tagensis]